MCACTAANRAHLIGRVASHEEAGTQGSHMLIRTNAPLGVQRLAAFAGAAVSRHAQPRVVGRPFTRINNDVTAREHERFPHSAATAMAHAIRW